MAPSSFDYTEAASTVDIEAAAANGRRSRRDSQYSNPYGDEESVFAGPAGGQFNPSSVSRMSRSSFSRSRRRSRDSDDDRKSSVFDNIASLFGRHDRRPSLSRSQSDYAVETDSDQERWGYSSGEDDDDGNDEESLHALDTMNDNVSVTASMQQYDSDPPSPDLPPLLGSDPIFGSDSRVEIEDFSLLNPPPPGPPSRQTLYVPDEDSSIRFIGHEIILWRIFAWRSICFLTLGILTLLGHWFPRLWLRCVAREKAFVELRNGLVVVEVGFALLSLSALIGLRPYTGTSGYSLSHHCLIRTTFQQYSLT